MLRDSRLERLKQVRDQITSKVFSSWWYHLRAGTGDLGPHQCAATGAALRMHGRVLSQHVEMPQCLEGSQNALVELTAARSGGEVSPLLSQIVAQLLRDEFRPMRRAAAAEAVGRLGPAAPPALLADLAPLLRDQISDVRAAAAEAVGRLGPAAPPAVLTGLPRLLLKNGLINQKAATGIRKLTKAGVRFLQRREELIPKWRKDLIPKWVVDLAQLSEE